MLERTISSKLVRMYKKEIFNFSLLLPSHATGHLEETEKEFQSWPYFCPILPPPPSPLCSLQFNRDSLQRERNALISWPSFCEIGWKAHIFIASNSSSLMSFRRISRRRKNLEFVALPSCMTVAKDNRPFVVFVEINFKVHCFDLKLEFI